VEAANALGGGAVVTLFFPPSDEPLETEADGERSASPPSSVVSPSNPASVLLVDDNDAVRATTALYLRDGGLAVIEAADAAAALRLLGTHRVNAMITDIVMPGEMDGMALAEAARAARPGLPVLLVSGYSERAAEAQQRGFPVIGKPYGLSELERRLRLMIEAPLPASL
jgi:CheY-like chemotaxis protein